MQEKNGWVTDSDDPNYHFPVKTLEQVTEEHLEGPYRPPRDEYWRDKNGRELKTTEEVIAHIIKCGAADPDITPARFKDKVASLLPEPWDVYRERWRQRMVAEHAAG